MSFIASTGVADDATTVPEGAADVSTDIASLLLVDDNTDDDIEEEEEEEEGEEEEEEEEVKVESVIKGAKEEEEADFSGEPVSAT